MRTLIILIIGAGLLSSCISTKKHEAAINNLQQEQEAQLSEINRLNTTKDSLMMELARSKGGNEALLATQDKLQSRIDQLQAEIENIGSNASTQKQSLNNELANRNALIGALENRLANLKETILRWENAQQSVAQEVLLSLQAFDSTMYFVEQRGGEVIVVLNEDLLFRAGSTSRFEQEGIDALAAISQILAKYPSLYIQIVGHTDNQDIARKSLDNWDYCLLRAGNVAKLLIDDFDLGANRILPAGKSEFAPRTSNETSEGRAENRRMELILSGASVDLVREINRELDRE